jgi:ankyrin repeat protein
MKRIRTSLIIVIGFCWYFLALSTQAQESDAQKLLLDSIEFGKIDVSGVRAALDKGANPNWVSDTKRRFSVIGHLAMVGPWSKEDKEAEEKSVVILQMLFKAGAKLQPCDQDILYNPVAEGWVLFTEVLLKNGANPTRPIDGWTPMEIAVSHGQANIVGLLRKYGVPALESKVTAQLRFISAAGYHRIPQMEEAIRNGARVNEKNRKGETALIKALSFPLFTIETYAAIQYLFEKGADPTIQGEGRFGKTTPLHLAVEESSLIFDIEMKKEEIKNERLKDQFLYARLVIESLLRHGALVSARDGSGMTPLHIAAQKNNIVGAKMLIDAGAKIMPRDDVRKTPLDYAESAEMIKLLKAHGAKEE